MSDVPRTNLDGGRSVETRSVETRSRDSRSGELTLNAATLNDADASALEALIIADFNPDAVGEPLRERARHVAAVLGLLETTEPDHAPSSDPSALINVTLARVSRARSQAHPLENAELSERDHDTLELLVSAGYRVDRLPGGIRARAKQQMAVLNLLGDLDPASLGTPADTDRLVTATLTRVQGAIEEQADRMSLETTPLRRRRSISDLVSVAALIMLGSAVVVPMVGAFREHGRRVSCQSNLMAAGLGFGSYANDFHDALPLASESRAGTPWWHVGDAQRSNSANLFTLARTSYANLSDLACSGNPQACRDKIVAGDMDWRSINQVSYSYQNMFATDRTRWSQKNTVVIVADRSPIIPLAMQGKSFDPQANSLNHAGRGQAVLFNDGTVRFLTTPVLENHDNVYLPRELEDAIARQNHPGSAQPLQGVESPAGADDGFVGP